MIKEKLKKICSYPIIRWILLSIVITYFCDCLNQRSFIEAFLRMVINPLNFLYNMLLVLIVVSLSGMFRRRKFGIVLSSFIWLGLGVTNFVVQTFRNTPLSFVDFLLLPSVISVFENYLTIFQMVLIICLILVIIILFVILYKKDSIKTRLIKKSIITFSITLVLAISLRTPLIKAEVLSDDYSNLENAYHDYGMPYCFVVSIIDRNVEKPEEYNEKIVKESLEKLNELVAKHNSTLGDVTLNSETTPNVIFLQLESFMDPNLIKNLNFSTNPTPFFSYLKENYPTGILNVPSFGAGTANVEFEIMTGLSLDYFGAGEYPYTSVLQDNTVETIGYNLKENGYFSTVVHNNRGTFYSRDEVFKNMGYDRFVSSEFICDLEYTQNDWFKDKCLTNEIMKALKSSEESDFIYTISVQAHGAYLDDLEKIENKNISCLFKDEENNEKLLAELTYYINQIAEVDMFLEELVTSLNNFSEPVILVMYGDHLPNLDFSEEDLEYESKYKSEYVVWSNYNTNLESKELYTYELSSYILENIGCDNGTINKLHQTKNENDEYEEMFHLFEYDMFSEMYLFNGVSPYLKIETMSGYNDCEIFSIKKMDEVLIIRGENFTLSSIVYFSSEEQDTTYIDKNTLLVKVNDLEENLKISVKQVSDRGEILSTTEEKEYFLEAQE